MNGHGQGCRCQACQAALLQNAYSSQGDQAQAVPVHRCGYKSQGDQMTFWCTMACLDAQRHVLPLPNEAFATPAVPAPTITKLAAQVTERLAVLDRVRPILSDAIRDAQGEAAIQAVTLLGVRIMTAILKE